MTGPEPAADLGAADRRLLVYLGAAMIAGGQPVYEVEDSVLRVAGRLGYPAAQVGATPTGVNLGLAPGEPATFEAIGGPLRLDQSAEVNAIRLGLVDGGLTRTQALERLAAVRSLPRRYPSWLMQSAWVIIAVAIALILQPGWPNVVAAALGGLVVMALVALTERLPALAVVLPTLAAFAVALGVFAAADAGLLIGPLRTVLPAIAVLLPGGLLVTGMSELAAGAMVAGASRLIFGIVQLLLLTFGVLAAAQLLHVDHGQLENVRVNSLGWWVAPVGLVLLCVGICLMESVALRLLPWIALMVGLAFAAQSLGQWFIGTVAGGFCGAFVASAGASVVTLIRPELPRLVVFLPSFWLLVPGSLGLMSVTALGVAGGHNAQTAVAVGQSVTAIALGLLAGSAVFRTFRGSRDEPPQRG
jgi:uncharacterized membrane protein YjjP (DUF1212 family)